MKDLWVDRNFSPMLLKEIDSPFDSEDYLYELKFDGIRALMFVSENEVYVQSRNKKDLTYLFPELSNIKSIVKKNVIFDGEIVSIKDSKPSFSELQKRLHLKNKNRIKKESEINPVIFVAFDILYEERDLTKLELLKRKDILRKYVDIDTFIKIKFVSNKGIDLFDKVKEIGLEGVVAKLKSGLYHINKRTDDFIKIKNVKDGDFFVGGYEFKKEGFISLMLGEYVKGKFHFVGKVSVRSNSNIYSEVISLRKSKNYFCDLDADIYYVKPSINCKIEYLERTKSNRLRHPIFREII